MGPGFLGTQTLSNKLTQILYTHIKHNLPEIIREINERKQEVSDRLTELGPPMPEDTNEKLQIAWTMVMDFCSHFRDTIAGKTRSHEDRKDNQRKFQGGAQIKIMYYNLLKEYAGSDYKVTKNYDDEYIRQAILLHEGVNMPGFPSAEVFVSLIRPEIEQLKVPALDLLNDVYNYLEELASSIQAFTFIRFPEFGAEIMEKIIEIMQEERERTRNLVESILNSEESYMFTNDPEYLNTRTDIITVKVVIKV